MGNFSKDPQMVLQEALTKGYCQVRFQQGKPVLDRELNLLGGLSGSKRLIEHHFGNGVPADSDGFRISGLDVANNDFIIEAGRCLVGGYEIMLPANTTYKNQPHSENVTTLPPGTSNVYLRVFHTEVTGAQDPDLLNSGDVGFETAVREKVEWEVLVTKGTINKPDHLHLALLNMSIPSVSDCRRTGLTVAAIQDEVSLARGSAGKLSGRLDASLAADGTLKSNTVNGAQIATNAVTTAKIRANAVTPAELQSHISDSSKRAVGGEHIQDASISISQLHTLVLEGEVSVPAAPFGEVAEQIVILQEIDQHVFFLVSVRYLGPRPPDLVNYPFELFSNWMHRTSILKPPMTQTFFHRHALVIQNTYPFAISVSYKAHRLF